MKNRAAQHFLRFELRMFPSPKSGWLTMAIYIYIYIEREREREREK